MKQLITNPAVVTALFNPASEEREKRVENWQPEPIWHQTAPLLASRPSLPSPGTALMSVCEAMPVCRQLTLFRYERLRGKERKCLPRPGSVTQGSATADRACSHWTSSISH